MKKVYLIGSLRNPEVPLVGNQLRSLGLDVFDDWWGAGDEADEKWQAYEQIRGRKYKDAIYGRAAENIFNFDLTHLNSSDFGVLMLPSGKSGHLELGYLIGQGKPSYVLFDRLFDEDRTRWDVMYRFATKVCFNVDDLIDEIRGLMW